MHQANLYMHLQLFLMEFIEENCRFQFRLCFYGQPALGNKSQNFHLFLKQA